VRIYRVIMAVLTPVLLGLTLIQRLRGRVAAGAVAERLGFVTARGAGLGIWLHGASNGELTSARWVLERLLADRPGLSVLVTANTGTAVAMVTGWRLPGVTAALSPVDGWGAARRLLRRWHPDALVVIENEFWPGRLAAARAAAVPVALIGARMSARSALAWARFAPGLMRRMLGDLAFVSAQDAGSAARLTRLGLPGAVLAQAVMLKAQVVHGDGATPPPVPRARILLAASTHPGEEALILAAFAQARGQFDLLIIAPRHPRRRAEVAGLIRKAGFGWLQRSQHGALPRADHPVFLADSMGEMALWYAMAGATVIGGSFVPLGGHTPYEPMAAGSAILHGPHMENFAEAAAALAAHAAALPVTDRTLGAALAALAPARQQALAQAARRALAPDGDADAMLARLLALLR